MKHYQGASLAVFCQDCSANTCVLTCLLVVSGHLEAFVFTVFTYISNIVGLLVFLCTYAIKYGASSLIEVVDRVQAKSVYFGFFAVFSLVVLHLIYCSGKCRIVTATGSRAVLCCPLDEYRGTAGTCNCIFCYYYYFLIQDISLGISKITRRASSWRDH